MKPVGFFTGPPADVCCPSSHLGTRYSSRRAPDSYPGCLVPQQLEERCDRIDLLDADTFQNTYRIPDTDRHIRHARARPGGDGCDGSRVSPDDVIDQQDTGRIVPTALVAALNIICWPFA